MASHTHRIIVLVDMDCFYCQVEEKLDPSLAGKPIAVVQYNAWRGGGLIAVNYLARDKGVTRHMRGDEAKEKCPDIELVRVPTVRGKADLSKYREGGKRVAEVLQTYTPLLQRASVDEAYLDITEAVEIKLQAMGRKATREELHSSYVVGCDIEDFMEIVYTNDFNNEHNLKLLIGGVIVEEIRAAVYEKTGYRCSAGIAHNKILAKLACGINKPNKQTLLPHDSVEEMYKTLPIRKIKSLGGKFGNTLAEDLKIKFMSELTQFSEKELMKKYDDKTANWLYNIARGIDLEPVETRLISKSIGCCKRFPGKTALLTTEDVTHWLSELSEELSERLEQDIQENNRKAKQIVLSFAQEVNKNDVHCSRTITLNSYEAKRILNDAFDTLRKHTQKPDGSFVIKFLGLSAGKFEDIKNVNDITSFFKTIDKKENIVPENNLNSDNINTECTEKVSSLKKRTGITTFFQNLTKNNDEILEKEEHSKKTGTLSILTANNEKAEENISNNDETTKKSGILNYFSANTKGTKNLDFSISSFSKTKKQKKNTLNNFFHTDLGKETKTSSSETKVFDVTQEEINLSDIENDAENTSDAVIPQLSNQTSTDCFSDSTIELDLSETLKNKTEYPFRSNELNLDTTERHSPNLNTGKSFFMRYIKRLETKKSQDKIEPVDVKNETKLDIISLDSNDSIKMDSNFEVIASSSKDIVNEISSDSIEENDLPIELIYSDNSNSDIISVLNEENNVECPECSEKIPKYMLVSHMDHHMALRLMEEEKNIFKAELELHKQKILNKSPTMKDIMSSKSKLTKTKSVKRKLPENNTDITSFFVQKLENNPNVETCPECGKSVESLEFDSHLDFHAAKKLHMELNPVKVVTKNNFKTNKKSVKSVNNNSVTNFFKPI